MSRRDIENAVRLAFKKYGMWHEHEGLFQAVVNALDTVKKSHARVRYSCQGNCGGEALGRPGLAITCGDENCSARGIDYYQGE